MHRRDKFISIDFFFQNSINQTFFEKIFPLTIIQVSFKLRVCGCIGIFVKSKLFDIIEIDGWC